MRLITDEIKRLREGSHFEIDYHNSNRYRLVLSELNGSKTAYYFGAPIYNRKSGRLVDLRFRKRGDSIFFEGSNAEVFLSDGLYMKNADGAISVKLPETVKLGSLFEAHSGPYRLYPTTNGAAILCDCKSAMLHRFTVETGQPFLSVKANDRCFAVMLEEFKPLVVFSCIGALDLLGNVIAPACVGYEKLTDKCFGISVSSDCKAAHSILFEVNMYENKLFQDTTVESANTALNNVYGGVGFIGRSDAYGEQWLYSRPDASRFSEIADRRIVKAVLHIPTLGHIGTELDAFGVAARFCSFGSSWSNKIAGSAFLSSPKMRPGYFDLDITPLIVNPSARTIKASDGFILKPKGKERAFSVISTGDSCFAPQITEINYR